MTIGFLSLAAYASQDVMFYNNPSISFFTSVIRRPTHCLQISHTIVLPELGNVTSANQASKLGRPYSIPIANKGDLINGIYLNFQYTGFNPENANPCLYSLIERVEFYVGDKCISTLWGDYIRIYNETSIRRSACQSTRTMSYLDDTRTAGQIGFSAIPLPFWFTEHISQSFPLSALSSTSPVKLNVYFNSLDTILRKDDDTTNTQFTILRVSVTADYFLLDPENKLAISSQPLSYLITQVEARPAQTIDIATSLTDPIAYEKYVHSLSLPFKKPVKELFWYIHDSESNVDTMNGVYSGNHWRNGLPQQDQMIEAWFASKDKTLTQPLPGIHYRSSFPSKYNRSTSAYFIYNSLNVDANNVRRLVETYGRCIYYYSFATSPGISTRPTGCVDLSCLDAFSIRFRLFHDALNAQVTTKSIFVYAVTYNRAIFRNGHLTLEL
jgi:hypothetical protein